MGLKVGAKVKGFKFDNYNYEKHGFSLNYLSNMNKHIGVTGIIVIICDRNLKMLVEFNKDMFWYPVIKNKIKNKLK
jgi:hypothetical protein